MIDRIVSVAFMLIRSPAIKSNVNANWVKRCFWAEKCDVLKKENFEFIANVVNILRRYYPQDVAPRKPAPRHILLALPMVLLANFVLSVLGYKVRKLSKAYPKKLTQRAIPTISVGKLWALPLTTESIYETFFAGSKSSTSGTSTWQIILNY